MYELPHDLPAQRCMLQASVVLAAPVQDPSCASTTIFALTLNRSPVPQVLEQGPTIQPPHWQSTVLEDCCVKSSQE